MDLQKTGQLIAFCRKQKGMTQQQLADKLNLSNKTISKWERGEGALDLSNLVPLAQALELRTDELLAGEQSPNKIAVAQKENPYRFTKAEKGWMMLGAAVGGILGLLAYNNGWI